MKEPRGYSRHGLHAIKGRVKVRGLKALDRRTQAARALLAWRDELISDLGGDENVSAAKRALIDAATRTKLYVEHLDAFLIEERTLVRPQRKTVVPVLRERQHLVDSLVRILTALGLERRAKRVGTLEEYMAERYSTPRPAALQGPQDGAGGVAEGESTPRVATEPSASAGSPSGAGA